MALNPSTKYPGRITAPDANYTYGSSQDESSPGAGDGTPYEKARANDIFGFQQSLLRAANIVPSGSAETQLVSEYTQAIVEIASGRASFYVDSGAANAYVLSASTNQQSPRGHFVGMLCDFLPTNSNTGGAATVNVAGLGVKSIYYNGVATLPAHIIESGILCRLRYQGTYFELLPEHNFPINTDSNFPYRNHSNRIILHKDVASTSFSISSSLTEDVWHDIGSTASGATNIYTALDAFDYRNGIKAFLLHVRLTHTGDVALQYYQTLLYGRSGGSAAGISFTELCRQDWTHYNNTDSITVSHSFDIWVPVNPDTGIFDLQWSRNSAGSASITMRLKGAAI